MKHRFISICPSITHLKNVKQVTIKITGYEKQRIMAAQRCHYQSAEKLMQNWIFVVWNRRP